MFEQSIRLLTRGWDATNAHAENLQAAIIGILLFILIATLAMWCFNISGLKEVNFIFFFIGGLYLVAKFSQPKMVVAGAVIGTVAGGLRDKDLSQSAAEGVKWLYKIALGLVLGFWVLAGMLATWSFENAPAAFFPVAAMTMLLAVMVEFFEMKGGMFKKVLVAYAVGVIIVALWQTISWKSIAPTEQPEATPPHEVQEASSATQGGGGMIAITLTKGQCSEAIIVPKGVDIKSTITGNVRQEKMDNATSEWTLMVDRASLYATRYCGDGQALYLFTPTP